MSPAPSQLPVPFVVPWPGSAPAAVFFDLDGTLADTAADLAAPVNAMRVERGLPALPLEVLRPVASMGARGLIGKGLDIGPDHPSFGALREEFLARYEQAMVVHTRLFDGMPQVLDTLEARGVRWGVVSNKIERYVRRVLDELGIAQRSVVAVGGDTAGHPKPRPEPLLHAARLAGVQATHCVYVGDDLRDVQAARAAGMAAVAAAYGYSGEDLPVDQWGADVTIASPQQLIDWLRSVG